MDSAEELEDTSEKKRSSMEARKFPQPAEEEPTESGNHPASAGLALPEMFLKVMLSFRLLKRNLKYSFFSLSFIKLKEEISIFSNVAFLDRVIAPQIIYTGGDVLLKEQQLHFLAPHTCWRRTHEPSFSMQITNKSPALHVCLCSAR